MALLARLTWEGPQGSISGPANSHTHAHTGTSEPTGRGARPLAAPAQQPVHRGPPPRAPGSPVRLPFLQRLARPPPLPLCPPGGPILLTHSPSLHTLLGCWPRPPHAQPPPGDVTVGRSPPTCPSPRAARSPPQALGQCVVCALRLEAQSEVGRLTSSARARDTLKATRLINSRGGGCFLLEGSFHDSLPFLSCASLGK